MSGTALRYVMALEAAPNGELISASEGLVAMVIAYHYSDIEHCARPAVATIKGEARLSEQRTHEVITSLIRKGVIERHGQGGRGLTCRFTFPGLKGQECLTESAKGQESLTLSPEKGTEPLTLPIEKGQEILTDSQQPEPERVRFSTEKGTVSVEKGSEISDPKGYTERVREEDVAPSLPVPSEPSETSRARRSSRPKKTAPDVSPEFVARMVATHGAILGVDVVGETIRLALSHKNAKKYEDTELYVARWLGKDAREAAERASKRPTGGGCRDCLNRSRPLTEGLCSYCRSARGLPVTVAALQPVTGRAPPPVPLPSERPCPKCKQPGRLTPDGAMCWTCWDAEHPSLD